MLTIAAAVILAIIPPIPFSGESLQSIVLEANLFPSTGIVAVHGSIGQNPMTGTCLTNDGVFCDLRFQNFFVFLKLNEALEGTMSVCSLSTSDCVLTRDVSLVNQP
jgi:hypothetical protein